MRKTLKFGQACVQGAVVFGFARRRPLPRHRAGYVWGDQLELN
jgi:hypothetical protein